MSSRSGVSSFSVADGFLATSDVFAADGGGWSPCDTHKLLDTDVMVQGLLVPVSLDGQPADMGLVISVSSRSGESSSLVAEDAT